MVGIEKQGDLRPCIRGKRVSGSYVDTIVAKALRLSGKHVA